MTKRKRSKLPLPLGVLVVIVALVWYWQPWNTLDTQDNTAATTTDSDCTLTVSFIDVGQGMATLLQHQDEFALIDTGDTQGADSLMAYLESQGVTQLTYLMGSHPHSDHIANFPEVLDTYPVENVILNVYDYDSKTWDNALSAVKREGVSPTSAMTGDTFTMGDVVFEILSPWQDVTEYSETNDTSIVVKISHGEDDFLLCGDATVYVENELIYRFGNDLNTEVYGVAHHGSYLSNSPQFLQAVVPDIYVISAGEGNQYDHPNPETLERITAQGGEVYRTDRQGTIVVNSNKNGVTVTTEAEVVSE